MKKKVLTLLLVFVIFISMATNTALASETLSNPDSEFLFEHLLSDIDVPYYYEEMYYHYVDKNDPESEIDWAIVYVATTPKPSEASVIVADRVITTTSIGSKYPVQWAIYDAELQKIISIEEVDVSKYDDFELGLTEARVGNPFGDADMDGILSIIDSTYIQQVLAKLREFSPNDMIVCGFWGVSFDEPHYISDIDGDGKRTIIDATAVQMKLARM